jgi:hypothetical protein
MDINNTKDVIEKAGGDQVVADAFGITWQAVQLWRKNRVPAERVLKLSKLSGISPDVIRPDVFKDL